MTEDAIAGGRLERLVPALERLTGARLRVWRFDGQAVRSLAPDREISPTWTPPLNGQDAGRRLDTPQGPAWFEPVREADGVWLEVGGEGGGKREGAAELAAIVGSVLGAERDAAQVAAELSERYEEIDLIYTISEILGHTIRLDEAAQRILSGRVAPRCWCTIPSSASSGSSRRAAWSRRPWTRSKWTTPARWRRACSARCGS